MKLHEILSISGDINVNNLVIIYLSWCLKVFSISVWVNIFNEFFYFDYYFLVVCFGRNHEVFSFLFRFVSLFNILNVFGIHN